MNINDLKGDRGENLFTVLITKWCSGRPLFIDSFLGEKHEATDYLVELLDPPCGHAHFYVQVKATMANYSGTGMGRKLDVQVTKDDVDKLKRIRAPVYVAGIDIEGGRGYMAAIAKTMTTGISGIPTRNALNCRNLKALWDEVNAFWTAQQLLATPSKFSL
jgi:hypothetical protein